MIEFWQIMLIIFAMWIVWGLTKPVIKPTVTDKLFKKRIEEEINEFLLERKRRGFGLVLKS